MAWKKPEPLLIEGVAVKPNLTEQIQAAQNCAREFHECSGVELRVVLVNVAEQSAKDEAAKQLAEGKAREIALLTSERDSLRKQLTEARAPVKVDLSGVIQAPKVHVDLASVLKSIESLLVGQTVAVAKAVVKPETPQA